MGETFGAPGPRLINSTLLRPSPALQVDDVLVSFFAVAAGRGEKRPLGVGQANSPAYRDDNDEVHAADRGPYHTLRAWGDGAKVPLRMQSLSNVYRLLRDSSSQPRLY